MGQALSRQHASQLLQGATNHVDGQVREPKKQTFLRIAMLPKHPSCCTPILGANVGVSHAALLCYNI